MNPSSHVVELRQELVRSVQRTGSLARTTISRWRPRLGSWSKILLIAAAQFVIQPVLAGAQSLIPPGDPSLSTVSTTLPPAVLPYAPPTEKVKFSNYIFDAYGPYPIGGSAVVAGIDQRGNDPPEWRQGAEGFGRRFGSNLGIVAAGTTTRFGLSAVLKEDSLYYRCDCRGFLPRIGHAVISTLTARRGADGHRVFSLPALVAPYAGSMTAVYAWYPSRFGAKDAFRMGNYSMLAYMGGNISLEFFYSGPHSLLSRMHLNNTHGTTLQGPNH